MVYSDSGPRKILAVAIVVIGLTMATYGVYGERIANWLNTQNLLSQVTPFTSSELDYLSTRNAQVSLDGVQSLEDLSALLLELLEASGLERQSSQQALEDYLNQQLDIDENVPALIKALIIDATLRYQNGATSNDQNQIETTTTSTTTGGSESTTTTTTTGTGGGTSTPTNSDDLVNDILSIIANHGAASNTGSVIQRHNTTRNILEALFEEL